MQKALFPGYTVGPDAYDDIVNICSAYGKKAAIIGGRKALATSTPVTLRYARTCYDHLAGELAVNIYEFMLREKWLTADGQSLTSAGKTQLESLGAVLNARPRRKPCCPCLDWSERRFHLGGDAGSALMALFEQKGWITRAPGYREVQVTDSGRAALSRLFNLKVNG